MATPLLPRDSSRELELRGGDNGPSPNEPARPNRSMTECGVWNRSTPVALVTAALAQLGAIHARLEGDLSVLRASRENLLLPVELVHEPTGTVVEVDEPAHFTSFRLATLELYAADAAVGFDLDEHKALCRAWCSSSDDLARNLPAKGFGFGGVPRERAYHDALLDLAAPAMGHPPVVRIAVVDGDGAAAYRRSRAALQSLR